MSARHGGGLLAVVEPAPGSPESEERFAVYADSGPLPAAVACYDPATRHIELRRGSVPEIRPAMPYRRYFGRAPRRALAPRELLARLGDALRFNGLAGGDLETDIPAGYTYLGQFIFHDLSHFTASCDRRKSARGAALALDSVFDPPDPALRAAPCPAAAGPMPVGCTLPGGFPVDLPRTASGEAVIADRRNDDLLPLAQIHMALLRFYNAVFAVAGSQAEARTLTRQHFQSIVLDDYLPRLVEPDVYEDVRANGRAVIFSPEEQGASPDRPYYLPIEFAAACARFGHSMVRYSYDFWNPAVRGATLPAFWSNTYNSAADPNPRLTQKWVTHWHRLFPLGEAGGRARRGGPDGPIMAARIGTRFAYDLRSLPPEVVPMSRHKRSRLSANLVTRSLERAHLLRLQSGQGVARRVNARLRQRGRPTFSPLDGPELLVNESTAVRALFSAGHGAGGASLMEHTPLWLYTLKEAEARRGGFGLGPLGSRIVMESVHAAIEAAPRSILSGRGRPWRPDPRLAPASADRYTFSDLLRFAGLARPVPPF